jgi:uncharacterized ferritin-like protein (DUF455 family)
MQAPDSSQCPSSAGLRSRALAALLIACPLDKCAAVARLSVSDPLIGIDQMLVAPASLPGRLARPELVSPGKVKKYSLRSIQGHAALIHSLAHIELNAVNLALDILWRFAGLPAAFYLDWLKVAIDEARHFGLLNDHLNQLGYHYGDFSAHNGLWEMAERTQADLLARLALVPRTLEARGLDASPLVRDKLISIADPRGAAILSVILTDEISHVWVGNRWYRWLCEQRGLDPMSQFPLLAQRYDAPTLRGPFNLAGRRAAGFTEAEIAALPL